MVVGVCEQKALLRKNLRLGLWIHNDAAAKSDRAKKRSNEFASARRRDLSNSF